MNGTCALCLEDKPLLESHIYPRHVYKKTGMLQKKKKIKQAIYEIKSESVKVIDDPNWDGDKLPLLCRECEQRLGNLYETYFCEVFLNQEPPPKKYDIQVEYISGKSGPFIILSNLNYQYIKLYVLSIMWRMAVVGSLYLSDFQKENLRKMILTGNVGKDDYYSIYFAATQDASEGRNQLISPFTNLDFNGMKSYYTVIGHYAITVSQYGPTTDDFELYQMWELCKLKSIGRLSIELAGQKEWSNIIFQMNGLGKLLDKYKEEMHELRNGSTNDAY